MHPTITTLRYRLLEGSVCLEPLRVLQARTVLWRDRQVTFSILGASHAVCIASSEETLTELLACATPEGRLRVLLECPAIVPASFCHAAQGLLCRIHVETFALREGDRLQDQFSEQDQLAFAFPTPDVDAVTDTPPWTRIGWRIESGALAIETVHTYPEAGQGVRSRTTITMEGKSEDRHGE